MPRGDNPKSRENLSKGKPFNTETARKASAKSAKTRAALKTLSEDLREALTAEDMRAMNERLIAMAKRGNLRAYEMVRDGIEKVRSENDEPEALKLARELLEGVDSAIN